MTSVDPSADPAASAKQDHATGAPDASTLAARLREIPPVSAIVVAAREAGSTLADDILARAARIEVDTIRAALVTGEHAGREEIQLRVVDALLNLERPRLAPVLNATGVVVHTNLGRAPVSAETADAMAAAAASAVALEIEPESNERGGRMREIAGLLRALTGAESALVVNNCASAVLLALATVAAGKGVVVSRGEAVEIGGNFRVPDVLRQSGARLIEVGTTNRTYVRDYAAATDEETAAYLKVHPSNFRALGFVHAASTADLVALAAEHEISVLEDLGSGALLDTARFGLAPEPTLTQAIAAGVELVMASGDKLLGGPQAGIILGKARSVDRVARHPLARAIRADKVTLAGIAATLRHYARGEAETHIPIWRMIAAGEEHIRKRADAAVTALRQAGNEADVESVQSTIGGGSLPGETLPSWAVVLRPPDAGGIDELARRMRLGAPGVFGRIERDGLLLDLRTILPEDDASFTAAMQRALVS
jgi:L-seryl-tRNA(Ser) seleniumtransferase